MDIVEEVVESRYSSVEEQKAEASLLTEAKKKRMSNTPQAAIFTAKLTQLKLQMEEFLTEPVYDN